MLYIYICTLSLSLSLSLYIYDNFGSIRGKREKDFWEELQSLGVTNNTQEQEGKRTFSLFQLEVVKRGVGPLLFKVPLPPRKRAEKEEPPVMH